MDSGPSKSINFLLVFEAKTQLGIPVRKWHEFPMILSSFFGFPRNSAPFYMQNIKVFDHGSHLLGNAWISTVCSPDRNPSIRTSAQQFSFKTIIKNQLPGHLKKKLFWRWAEKLFLQKQLSGINPRPFEKEIVLAFWNQNNFLESTIFVLNQKSHWGILEIHAIYKDLSGSRTL